MNYESNQGTDWLQPVVAQSGLRRFIETVRSQTGLVLAVFVAVTLASVVYVYAADKVYEADVNMLVSPIPAQDPVLSGLGLIRESSDPTLDVQTAAQLITTAEVADAAAEKLGTTRSPQDLLADVKAEPVGQSNIVAIVAEGPTAAEATDLANAFGEAVVEVRTDTLHSRIDVILPRLRRQIQEFSADGTGADALTAQIVELESLRAGPDPTIRLETPATAPESPVWPRPLLTLLGGMVLGLTVGAAAAYLLRSLDPRLRREEQLRENFRLPILARIPREPQAARDRPLQPARLSTPTLEAYRTLRTTSTATGGEGGRPRRSLLITSPAPGEGKTSTAVNLAVALARGGDRVVLIEADLRRPSMEKTFGFTAPHGVVSVLTGEMELADALVDAPGTDGNLSLLMAGRQGGEIAELFGLPAGQRLVQEAEAVADYVVVDSPPLTAVVDSMPLARKVDDVLIVVRLDRTHLRRIRELGELLAANGITPAGLVVLGGPPPQGSGYYHRDEERDRATTSRSSTRRAPRSGSGSPAP